MQEILELLENANEEQREIIIQILDELYKEYLDSKGESNTKK